MNRLSTFMRETDPRLFALTVIVAQLGFITILLGVITGTLIGETR